MTITITKKTETGIKIKIPISKYEQRLLKYSDQTIKTFKNLPPGFASLPDNVRFVEAKGNRSAGFIYEIRYPRKSVASRRDQPVIDNYYELVQKLNEIDIKIPTEPDLIKEEKKAETKNVVINVIPQQKIVVHKCTTINSYIEDLHKVIHCDNTYYVFRLLTIQKGLIPVIIDECDFPLLKFNWIISSSGYVGRTFYKNKRKMVEYLHNCIMGIGFMGRGTIESIDHLNRIGTDNRRSNLQLKSHTNQNHNKKKRSRNIILPDDCGLIGDDIPQNVCFRKALQGRAPHFSVEIKHKGKRVFRRKTSQSTTNSLIDKLQQAKIILRDVMVSHPEWFEGKAQNGDLLDIDIHKSYNSYYDILNTLGFDDPYHPYDPDMGNHTKTLLTLD